MKGRQEKDEEELKKTRSKEEEEEKKEEMDQHGVGGLKPHKCNTSFRG